MTDHSSRMRAAVLTAPRHFDLQHAPLPQPAPGQVRVRLAGSGVCASNIPAFEGREWFNYPLPPGELGHEGWGRVDAVGEAVADLMPGDAVAALSFKAYAEYDLARADQVVKLPPELADEPFPGEALGCAMNIFERADIHSGHTVAVIGVGFLGGALIQLAAERGARVIAVSRSATSLQLARDCGASDTVSMDDHARIIAEVDALTGGRFCERVIEATGKPWPLDLAGELTGVGGKLIIAGYHQDGLRQVNVQLWNWRGIDVINAHERDPQVAVAGMRRAIEAVLDHRLQLAPLITHRYPLAQINQALEDACNRPDGFTKAVVLMEPAHD